MAKYQVGDHIRYLGNEEPQLRGLTLEIVALEGGRAHVRHEERLYAIPASDVSPAGSETLMVTTCTPRLRLTWT